MIGVQVDAVCIERRTKLASPRSEGLSLEFGLRPRGHVCSATARRYHDALCLTTTLFACRLAVSTPDRFKCNTMCATSDSMTYSIDGIISLT